MAGFPANVPGFIHRVLKGEKGNNVPSSRKRIVELWSKILLERFSGVKLGIVMDSKTFMCTWMMNVSYAELVVVNVRRDD